MFTTTLGPTWTGKAEWALPYDLWGTLIATVRLVHGNVGGLYTQPTGLVSLPGAAIILLPCAAVIAAAGLSLQIPGPHNLHPPVWLLAGPYEIALCCVTLFAADALAEQLGVTKWKRGLLAVASAVALWNVSARWGHPEDAVAVGLLLYAVLALSRSRTALAGSPAPRSASSRWCCSRCRCCSRPCRGGECRRSSSGRPCRPRCCSAWRRWPTGTPRTPR
jgi:hypothetical protein